MSTEPHSNLSPKLMKKVLPSLKILNCLDKCEEENAEIDFGFLVGIISMRGGVNKKVIGKDTMKIKIGKNNEI